MKSSKLSRYVGFLFFCVTILFGCGKRPVLAIVQGGEQRGSAPKGGACGMGCVLFGEGGQNMEGSGGMPRYINSNGGLDDVVENPELTAERRRLGARREEISLHNRLTAAQGRLEACEGSLSDCNLDLQLSMDKRHSLQENNELLKEELKKSESSRAAIQENCELQLAYLESNHTQHITGLNNSAIQKISALEEQGVAQRLQLVEQAGAANRLAQMYQKCIADDMSDASAEPTQMDPYVAMGGFALGGMVFGGLVWKKMSKSIARVEKEKDMAEKKARQAIGEKYQLQGRLQVAHEARSSVRTPGSGD